MFGVSSIKSIELILLILGVRLVIVVEVFIYLDMAFIEIFMVIVDEAGVKLMSHQC
jgi:hypothetical protein